MKKIAMSILLTSTIYAGGIFSVGHKNISITAGTDTAYGNTYTVMGIDAHYFIVDNISMGISYHTWLGDDPSINQITIPMTYHIPLNIGFSPYLGGFYSRTMIGEDNNDYNSYGGRVGMTMQTSPSSYMSFGWVQEFNENGDNVSSRGYPEVSAGISF
ncbi:hypothetical protein GSY74_06505 [Sulfurovum sp. bin170]|uniref:hypothetical protein n=1 Tax=Sulfurovum sp. bin170 TaxID=2695268 RepID=UPI0013E0E516|nr:hypothetical protein [Sulfurovum sp. bin170]NEW60931.1 hypothetical protein [Sulfurovum sp. bin170]